MCTLITPSNSVYHVLLFSELSTPLRNLCINLYWIELKSTNSFPFPTMFCSGFVVVIVWSLNHVSLFCNLMNCSKTPLSMEFSRQEYWNGLQFPSPGYLPDPGVEPTSPASKQILYLLSHLGRPGFMVDRQTLIFPDTTGLLAHLPSLRGSLQREFDDFCIQKPISETNECIWRTKHVKYILKQHNSSQELNYVN